MESPAEISQSPKSTEVDKDPAVDKPISGQLELKDDGDGEAVSPISKDSKEAQQAVFQSNPKSTNDSQIGDGEMIPIGDFVCSDQKYIVNEDTSLVLSKPTVEPLDEDFSYKEIIKQLGLTQEDLSSGSSEDSQPDSESSLWDETTQSSQSSDDSYKSDVQFTEVLEDFETQVSWRSNLVVNFDTLLNEEFFPLDTKIAKYPSVKLKCESLKKIQILAPRVPDYRSRTSCDAFLHQIFGGASVDVEIEAMLRDHILFLLKSVKAPNLETFIFENVDYGVENFPEDRQSVFEEALVHFVRTHSSQLKKISLKMVRPITKDRAYKNNWKQIDKMQRVSFPKLEELSVIFGDEQGLNSKTNEVSNEMDSILDSYWTNLLKSTAKHGKLRKLIWTSNDIQSWTKTFAPVILQNAEVLETLHIICIGTEDLRKSAETKVRENRLAALIGPTQLSRLDVVLSCVLFENMGALKSLYLVKPRCFLTHLALLPPQLEELCLDNIYLNSTDLAEAIEILGQLKTLRLVDNIPSWAKSAGKQDSGFKKFGVNEDVVRAIFNHRKLNNVLIWGHCADLEADVIDTSSPGIPISTKPDPLGKTPGPSMFQKFRDFLQRVYCKSRKYNAESGKYAPKQTLLSILQQIAIVHKDRIIFNQHENQNCELDDLYD